ncbi:MAG: hypothetical protein JWO36_7431 [Myxococcales bacterium]|nr:hypothetical protein [Myxococcales bacterium]
MSSAHGRPPTTIAGRVPHQRSLGHYICFDTICEIDMEHQEVSVEPTPGEDERDVQNMFRTIERSGTLPAGIAAFDAADIVLCALEMRLPRLDAQDVADVMPPTLRRILTRCVVHRTDRPEISFDEQGFVRLIARELGILFEEAERLTRAVFEAVQQLMPEDEIRDVRNRLPRELDTLWYPYIQSNREPSEPPSTEPEELEDRPVEEPTEKILHEIELSGVLPTGVSATDGVRAVLCTLSLELTGGEIEELAELAPRTLRGLLTRCARHRGERPQILYEATFLRHVAAHLGVDVPTAERITRTVLAALRGRLPPAEVPKIDNRLPRSVRRLWTS